MRISERHRYDSTRNRVESAKQGNSESLVRVSTQKRINEVSDDPVGFGQTVREKNNIESIQQHRRNINYAKGYLERTETALKGLSENLMRAKELAVRLASANYDSSSRQAAAFEMEKIVESVVRLGNTTYGNRYVFGGFRTLTPPISTDGHFSGDDGAIFLEVGSGDFKQVNIQGRNLFEANTDEEQAGHFGLVHSLEILHGGLKDDNLQQIRVAMDEIDHQLSKTTSYQASIGAIWSAVDATEMRSELNQELAQKKLSSIEDVDTYRAISDFKRSETVLQSTLMASNKLLQPSLLNFLQ